MVGTNSSIGVGVVSSPLFNSNVVYKPLNIIKSEVDAEAGNTIEEKLANYINNLETAIETRTFSGEEIPLIRLIEPPLSIKYVLKGKGKGVYGTGGNVVVTASDLERINDGTIINNIVSGENNDATVIDLGVLGDVQIHDAFNAITHELTGGDVYVEAIISDIYTLYRFLPTDAGTYGNGGILTENTDFQLLQIDLLQNDEGYFEGTYNQIKLIKEAGQLVPNGIYILTDFQTEYFIENSNSDGIVNKLTIQSNVSGWATVGNYNYDLFTGMQVTVTGLPNNYTGAIKIGDVTTVSSSNQNYYFKFANGMQGQAGFSFKYYLQRYADIEESATILDAYGKPVLKPKGIINTEVHDGTPYMQNTASENFTPPIERIVLTAATKNTFKPEAFSDTFNEDQLIYDFEDDTILNDNKENIGTRKGSIKQRKNDNLLIDAPLDWRVVRFRRWLLDEADRVKFINRNEDAATSRTAYNGNHLYTSVLTQTTHVNRFYIAIIPQGSLNNLNANAIVKSFDYLVSDLTMCKDYTLFKIDENLNPVNVSQFKVKDLKNTIFMGLNTSFNYKLYFVADNATFIRNNTFIGNAYFYAFNTQFHKIIAFDDFHVEKGIRDSYFSELYILQYFGVQNFSASHIDKLIIGALNGSIAGNPNPQPAFKGHFFREVTNTRIVSSVIGTASHFAVIKDCNLKNCSFFLWYAPINNGSDEGVEGYSRFIFDTCMMRNVDFIFPASHRRVILNNWLFPSSNGNHSTGRFIYTAPTGTLYETILKYNKANHHIYREVIDETNTLSLVDFATPAIEEPEEPEV